MKKLPIHVFRVLFWGPFLKNGGSAKRPTMNRFANFSTFYYTKSKFEGGPFYEKNCQLMYLGPYSAGRFGPIGVSANQPKFDQFWLLRTFSCTKSKLRHIFLPKWTQKKIRPKRMKGDRDIRLFIAHRVTEWQSHRVTESHHFHSLYGRVKFFYAHFW